MTACGCAGRGRHSRPDVAEYTASVPVPSSSRFMAVDRLRMARPESAHCACAILTTAAAAGDDESGASIRLG
jgi:hypothetical protein